MAAARRSPQRKFAIMVGRQSTPNFGFCLKRERANSVLRSLFALLRPGDKFNVQSLGDEGARAAAAEGAESGGGGMRHVIMGKKRLRLLERES